MWNLQSSLKAVCMTVAALTAFSCSQEDWTGQSTLNGNTTIVASFEGAGANTRTSVTEENKVVWNKNDAFGLFYTTSSQTTPKATSFSCSTADGTSTSASFSGTLDDGATTSYAVYPYDQAVSLSGSTVTMKLPATFAYTQASNGPMYAVASDISKSIGFKHLAGLLKLTVSKGISADAKKFVITADKAIAGTCTADLSTTAPALAAPSTGGSKTITVTLTFTGAQEATFYIPIPAGTYTTLSAKLLGSSDAELFPAKEWTNITVARAGILTASFGYVKIDAGTNAAMEEAVAAALPTTAPATETTTNLQITSALDATSGTGVSSIGIPVLQNSNVSLALAAVPTTSEQKPLLLKDNSTTVTESAAAVNTMTVAIPEVSSGGTAPCFTIAMPQTTVELAATGEKGTTYGTVTAKTATSTLVVKEGVTVNNLIVQGGNVRVAGTIVAMTNTSGHDITLIKETGATLPGTTTGFTVIDAALYDLKTALAKGENHVLTADVNITGASDTVPAGKTATLDLNGHTITADNSTTGRITVLGNFTLKDSKGNGQIIASKDYVKDSYDGGIIKILGENAHMTMESGTINTVRADAANKGQFAIVLAGGGDFTMTGGKIEAGWYAVSGNGDNKTQNSVIEIKGGELISTADYAIYLPQSGTTNISGGVVFGQAGGISMQRGTLNISGTAMITGKGIGNTGNWGDGTGGQGNYAVNIAAKYGDCTLNISGGTLIAEGNALSVGTGAAFKKTISISGGTFSDPSALGYLAAKANVKVKLLKDYEGPGLGIYTGGNGAEATIEVDLNTHSWTLTDDPLFGSTGTKNHYFHLEKGAIVTFKNGTIQPKSAASVKMLIQNYCTLALNQVTLLGGTACGYVISNNNGSCTITGSTITASADKVAFDVYSYKPYADGVTVTVNAGSTINGAVEFDGDSDKKNGKLIINGGTFNGDLKVNEAYYDATNPNIIIKDGAFGNYTGWSTYKK